MRRQALILAVCLIGASTLSGADTPAIVPIDSATQTEALLAKPGTYLGEKFVFEQRHSGEILVRTGVWDFQERMKKQIVRIGDAALLRSRNHTTTMMGPG